MHHQTKCRESREKKCQAEGVPRTDAVNGRDSQAVRRRSYRLSLFFIAFHSFRNFHRPACPGSIGMIYSFTFIHRLVCDSGPFFFPKLQWMPHGPWSQQCRPASFHKCATKAAKETLFPMSSIREGSEWHNDQRSCHLPNHQEIMGNFRPWESYPYIQ